MKSQISENDLKDFYESLTRLTDRQPQAAVKSLLAKPGRKGRLCVRIEYIKGLDRFQEGQVFSVGGSPEKSVRFISTTVSHGDANPENWFVVMHVEPINCECEDLENVFLISDDAYPSLSS
ncbi:hypothetical protein Pan153_01890 [Gimesia panareensis]|uniref:Uncharacterized protein n=1 Tax=Gimesia panareensis TaxID=2527978 RepID=A0A518FGV5_9PLAN|nr:hypothetical protein [Gimesia panareensis]QDV15575.1 hypothetical protein Pan153_01890 [Gimesia panareensis]